MTYILSFIIAFFESTMHLTWIDTFAGRKDNKKSIRMMQIACLTGLTFLCFMFLHLRATNILGVVLSVFLVAFFSSRKWWLNLLLSVTSVTVMGVIELLTLYSIAYLAQISLEEACLNQNYVLLGSILSKGITLLVYMAIAIKKEAWKIKKKPEYWMLFAFILFVYIMAGYLIFAQQFESNNIAFQPLIMMVTFGFLFNIFFTFMLFGKMVKQMEEEEKRSLLEQRVAEQKRYMDEILTAQNEIRKVKHDMINHFIALEAYMKQNKNDEGIQYIERIRGGLTDVPQGIYTGNLVLDAVLSSKKVLAEKNNISFSVDAIIPKEIPLEPTDICIIFGNAIDNAIEACQRSEKTKEIQVILSYKNNDLCCRIINTLPTQMPGGKTSKSDKINHGFGLEIIRQTLEKYNHMFSIQQENGMFVLSFFITCP